MHRLCTSLYGQCEQKKNFETISHFQPVRESQEKGGNVKTGKKNSKTNAMRTQNWRGPNYELGHIYTHTKFVNGISRIICFAVCVGDCIKHALHIFSPIKLTTLKPFDFEIYG